MKTLISGAGDTEWLNLKTMISKWIGLTFSVGTGLFVGALGPFVHMGALIANNTLDLPPFRFIKKERPNLFYQIIVVGCSIGVGTALGVPIGGTLFGIEVTSTFYMTRSYWWTNFAAPIGTSAVDRRWLHVHRHYQLALQHPRSVPLAIGDGV